MKYDIARLEKQAYAGTVNTDPLPAAEYRYIDRLKRLYEAYRSGMPKERAEMMKNIALRDYESDIEERERCRKVYKEHQENYRKFRELLERIEKSTTPVEKLRAALEIVSAVTGDIQIVGRNI